MLAGELPQVVDFAKTLPAEATPERVQMVWDNLRHRIPVSLPDDPTQLIRQAAQSLAAFVAPRLGSVLANLLGMLGSIFVMLFAMFFLLRDSDRVVDMLRRVLPFPAPEREQLIKETHDLVIASVGAGLAVAAVQGAIGGLTFWAMGVGAPAAWTVAIAICSLIPVVGATLVWVPVAVWWALSGRNRQGHHPHRHRRRRDRHGGQRPAADAAERTRLGQRPGGVHRPARRRLGVRVRRTGGRPDRAGHRRHAGQRPDAAQPPGGDAGRTASRVTAGPEGRARLRRGARRAG